MLRLIRYLGRLIGIHFCPDNHVVPVLRLGRYHRSVDKRFVWVFPVFERTLPPVKTGLHVGNFWFDDVLSKDNIHYQIRVTVLFKFDPASAIPNAAAQLVRGGDALLQVIVRDFTDRRLRRLVSNFNADELSDGQVVDRVEKALAYHLKYEMSMLGLEPLKAKDGGVMIKELIAPEALRRTMLDAKHDEAILEVLRRYPVPELIQLLNQVVFANSLKDRSGDVALMLGNPELIHLLSQTGKNGGNGRYK